MTHSRNRRSGELSHELAGRFSKQSLQVLCRQKFDNLNTFGTNFKKSPYKFNQTLVKTIIPSGNALLKPKYVQDESELFVYKYEDKNYKIKFSHGLQHENYIKSKQLLVDFKRPLITIS